MEPAAIRRRTRRLEISESQNIRCTPDGGPRGFPQGRNPCRRRLQSTSTPAAATVTISSMQFNAYGSPSSATEAGVTSITVTKTSDGEVRDDVSSCSLRVRSTREGISSARWLTSVGYTGGIV